LGHKSQDDTDDTYVFIFVLTSFVNSQRFFFDITQVILLDAVLVAVGFDSVTGVTRDLGKRHDFTVSVAQLVRMLENSFFSSSLTK
jgi:hypothetical protein